MPKVAAVAILLVMTIPVADGAQQSPLELRSPEANAIVQRSTAPKLLSSGDAWPRAVAPAIDGGEGAHASGWGVANMKPDESMQDSFYKAIEAVQLQEAAWAEEDSYGAEGGEKALDLTTTNARFGSMHQPSLGHAPDSPAGRVFSTSQAPGSLKKEPVPAGVQAGTDAEWLSGSFLLQLILLAALAMLIFLMCFGLHVATAALARWGASNNSERTDRARDLEAEPCTLSCIPSPARTTLGDTVLTKPYLVPEMV
jgi:hypothetical protein